MAPHKAGRALAQNLRSLYDMVEVYAGIGEPTFIKTLDLFDESLKKLRPLLNNREQESDAVGL